MRSDTGDILRHDIGAITLDSDAIITTLYSPICKVYISAIPGIDAVSIDYEPLAVTRRVHVNI